MDERSPARPDRPRRGNPPQHLDNAWHDTGASRFAVTPLAVIDLLAILPFYVPFVGIDLRFVRAVRLFRVFRIAKLGRYSHAVRTIGRVLLAKKEELGVTLDQLFSAIERNGNDIERGRSVRTAAQQKEN